MINIEITYVQKDGAEQTVVAQEGMSLMEAALSAGIPNILGLCGGTCSCGTCHCHLSETDYGTLAAPTEMELELLESLDGSVPTSRLGCQVKLIAAHSGMRVKVPPLT